MLPAFDRSVPLLIVKIGGYPLSHQGLAAVRSLGRVGVPVYTVTEDRFTPQARSRFLADRFVLPTTGAEPPAELVGALVAIGRRLSRPTVLLPTDDVAAVLLAEHAPELAACFLQPKVPADLPRRVANKHGLAELSAIARFRTPRTVFPTRLADVRAAGREIGFPLVVKNADPFLRLDTPAVASTTILHTETQLLEVASQWPDPPGVVLQEHIPAQVSEDWVFHGYFSAELDCLASFTGVMVRSWPPQAGVTSMGRAVHNERLAQESERLCREIGFRGIVDLDWRYDARDDQYKLVDFNPRAGANLRMFVNGAGIDVVRALHLDLTGRPVPAGPAIEGRRLVVEHLDLPSLVFGRSHRSAGRPNPPRVPGPLELAWFAIDDPVPFFLMVARIARPVGRRLMQAVGWAAGRVRLRGRSRMGGRGSEDPARNRPVR